MLLQRKWWGPSFFICFSPCLYYYALHFLSNRAILCYSSDQIMVCLATCNYNFYTSLHLTVALKMQNIIVSVSILLKCLFCFSSCNSVQTLWHTLTSFSSSIDSRSVECLLKNHHEDFVHKTSLFPLLDWLLF